MRKPSAPALATIIIGLVFIALTIVVKAQWLTPWDINVIHEIRTLDSPFMFHAMRVVSAIANGKWAIPIALAVTAWFIAYRDYWAAKFYAATCLVGWGVNIALKEIIRRHRPIGISPKLTDAGGLSYPSGHAMLAVMVFGLGAYLLTRRASRVTCVFALGSISCFILLVCLSRIFLGAHWPTDTIGAVLAGTAWVTGAWALYAPVGAGRGNRSAV